MTRGKAGLTLGIETSGTVGSVALLDPAGSVREAVFSEGLIHGVALAPSVREILEEAGTSLDHVSLVAVGTGPGSYTGVRVGVAFAKGLGLASGIPVVGVGSLDAMAMNAPEGATVVTARDARVESLFLGVYRVGAAGVDPVVPLRMVLLDEVPPLLPESALVLGDAVEKFGDLLSGGGRTLGERSLWRCAAATVARLGAERARRDGPDDVHDLAPIYLRASEAEERWKRGERPSR